MVQRKHDLEFQVELCRKMMVEGGILPFPFERAAILLHRAKRFEEEIELCEYVENWCRQAEDEWDGKGAKIWKSPRFRRCVARVTKARAKIAKLAKR